MSQPTWIGQTLGGRYEIIELLGQGGMSAVYKANDPNLRRVVAVKLIHSHLSDNPEFIRRFEEEAAAVASLRHPNIIQVYDFNHDGPTFYIVFEFIPGQSLQVHLKRLNEANRLLTYEETAAITTNVADALSYAHNRGLVHRDIKPANVMLNVHGQAILMDFGVVKIVGGNTHTATGAVLGTATYMSPEQIQSEKVDARSDIYSLGVMLFEMVSARPPFQADSTLTMMMMHINDPVPDLWTIRPDVPGDLAEIIYKCLAKDPGERFQKASELVSDLREAEFVPPADRSTIIIPPAGADFAGQSTAEIMVDAPSQAGVTATKTSPDRNKMVILGGIAGVMVLLLCIAAAVTVYATGFLSGDDSELSATETAVVAIAQTEESENAEITATVETPVATPTDALVIEQPSSTATLVEETETSPPTTADPDESETPIVPTPEILPYAGVEINIMTISGQRVNTLKRHGSDFEALTGAKVNVSDVPRSQFYQEILNDEEIGSNTYDGWFVLTQWLYDFVVAGYVEELTGDVATDPAIDWEDIAPIYRDFTATFSDRIFLIPLRGHLILGYYRSDLLEENGLEHPRTWDEYLEIATIFHGQDLNDDGEPDYGSCIPKAFHNIILVIASSMLQSQGTSQGIFFDSETMEPLVDNEAFYKAMEIYDTVRQYEPPEDLPLDDDEIDLFNSGRCALTIFDNDLAIRATNPEKSVVADKLGTMIVPGSTQVIDRGTGLLVDCDERTCPYAIDGINYAPFISNLGWSGGINAGSDDFKKAAVYDFLSFMSQPAQSIEDVTSYSSGLAPYRMSHITDQEPWIDAGLSQQAAASFLAATQDSLNHPNVVLDMLIPQNREYKSTIYNLAFIGYQSGEISQDETVRQIYNGWEQLTNDLGREEQLAAYLTSLGLE